MQSGRYKKGEYRVLLEDTGGAPGLVLGVQGGDIRLRDADGK